MSQNNELTPEELKLFTAYGEYLIGWTERALAKFKAGIIEHRGESIEGLDLEKEIEHEVQDITAYNFFKTKQNKHVYQ